MGSFYSFASKLPSKLLKLLIALSYCIVVASESKQYGYRKGTLTLSGDGGRGIPPCYPTYTLALSFSEYWAQFDLEKGTPKYVIQRHTVNKTETFFDAVMEALLNDNHWGKYGYDMELYRPILATYMPKPLSDDFFTKPITATKFGDIEFSPYSHATQFDVLLAAIRRRKLTRFIFRPTSGTRIYGIKLAHKLAENGITVSATGGLLLEAYIDMRYMYYACRLPRCLSKDIFLDPHIGIIVGVSYLVVGVSFLVGIGGILAYLNMHDSTADSFDEKASSHIFYRATTRFDLYH